MSRKVNPLVLTWESDLKMMKSIFFTYFERAERDDYLSSLEKELKKINEFKAAGQINDIEPYIEKYILLNTYEKRDTEKYILGLYRSNTSEPNPD